MITTYQELLPMVIPELRNCPEPLVLQALERAGRDFCTRTTVWQKELDAISIVADQAEYPLDVDETVPEDDAQPEIRWIDWVKINGGIISSNHYHLVLATEAEGVTAEYSLKFRALYVPKAAIEDGMTLNVVLVPHRNSGYLTPFILGTYGDALASGALYHLLSMPRKPWADPDRGMYHYHEWSTGVARAMGESYNDRKTGSLQVKLNSRPWL